jgi:1-acyl-sn-glycerol-3-phosphate acyltransferase
VDGVITHRHQQVVFDTLNGLLAELGNRPMRISPSSDLERDLGLGSLERVELITRLQHKLLVKLPEAVLAGSQTPASLMVALASCSNGHRAAAASPISFQLESSAGNVSSPLKWQVPASVRSLVELARFRAETEGSRTHVFLLDGDTERQLSFADLWNGGLRVAAGLAELGVEPGFRAAILLPTGTDFFTTFVGVLVAGGVPVPLYPPANLRDLSAYVEREIRILRSAQARVLVTDAPLLQVGKLLQDRNPSMTAVSIADLSQADSSVGVARVMPDDLALIQYSSGSTGDPKGVALSHRSLLANMRAIGEGLSFGPADIPVSWLPLYHDMGLIGTWLSPFLHGMQVVMMSPLQFLSRPERWLWAFHRYRGTLSPAPNFAYDLCARKVRDEDIEGLDLSSWRSAMNGSEPVRADTVERFCRRFAPYGFRREAMMPVYGLAENSVALAFPPLNRGPRFDRIEADVFSGHGRAEPSQDANALVFASCGRALPGHEIRIADASGETDRDEPDRVQGRILFRGPSSMSGYYGRPDATAAVRRGEWVDTGDLGYLVDGELYVTGRLKDLVIKGGRKYHPQDIEQAVQAEEGIRKNCVVAFAVPAEAGGEAIVVLAETNKRAERHPQLAAAIVAAVLQRIGTPADRVQLVRPGSLPKTSSGKLKRRESRQMYLDGVFDGHSSPNRAALTGLAARALVARTVASARRIGRSLHSVYSTSAAAATLVPGLTMVSLLCRSEEATWKGCRSVLRLATNMAGLRVRRGGSPIPATGAILVSNHSSNLDWLVLTLALEHPFLFTAKASVFSLPLLGPIARRLGHIEVQRRQFSGRQQSYQDALGAAQRGRLVHFFPEATFTRASGLRPFRLGAFQLAAEAGLPIIPVAICGTRRALRDGQKLLGQADIEVTVLPALAAPKPDLSEIARLRDSVREVLARTVGEPMLDIVTAALPMEAEAAS